MDSRIRRPTIHHYPLLAETTVLLTLLNTLWTKKWVLKRHFFSPSYIKGRKNFHRGAAAVEAPGGEKNAPAGAVPAVEAPHGDGAAVEKTRREEEQRCRGHRPERPRRTGVTPQAAAWRKLGASPWRRTADTGAGTPGARYAGAPAGEGTTRRCSPAAPSSAGRRVAGTFRQ